MRMTGATSERTLEFLEPKLRRRIARSKHYAAMNTECRPDAGRMLIARSSPHSSRVDGWRGYCARRCRLSSAVQLRGRRLRAQSIHFSVGPPARQVNDIENSQRRFVLRSRRTSEFDYRILTMHLSRRPVQSRRATSPRLIRAAASSKHSRRAAVYLTLASPVHSACRDDG